jgi:inosine-uridine nucleoside N-ribohydrolase
MTATVDIDSTHFELSPLHVQVETQGRLTTGMTAMRNSTDSLPAAARVALKATFSERNR